MKKGILSACTALLLSSLCLTAQAAGKAFSVLPEALCEDPKYNHLGYEWLHDFSVDGVNVSTGRETITLTEGQTLTISTRITENDKIPDIGEAATTYTVTAEDLKKGFQIHQEVQVVENAGRYKGCACKWEVEYTFKPVK